VSSFPCAGKAAAAAQKNRKIPSKIRKTHLVRTASSAFQDGSVLLGDKKTSDIL
jgi:hypothetical protein